MEQFLALIIPVTTPTQPPGGGGDKPPGYPSHPIYWPPGIWGPTDPRPTHPISGIPGLPGYEPPKPPSGGLPPWGIWGGANQPFPTPPIANVPGVPGWNPPGPGGGPGDKPPHIWGGGNEPFPTPPIVIPIPPDWKPPEGVELPPPGTTAPLPIGNQPVNPIVIPEYCLVRYPGYGWIIVGKPVPPTEPAK